ncbi:MAG: hypothetical protein ACP5SJ_00795 [Candidatus Micrarchaeia archaeon]
MKGKKTSNKNIKVEAYTAIAAAIVIAAIAYSIFELLPLLSIAPGNISQAANARFYEGFVYNYSNVINPSCLVLTYDPTLFNINNRTAAQMNYLYSQAMVQNFSSRYKCFVLDYGYWCHTPSGCPPINNSNYIPIINRTFQQQGQLFGFYYIRNISAVANPGS